MSTEQDSEIISQAQPDTAADESDKSSSLSDDEEQGDTPAAIDADGNSSEVPSDKKAAKKAKGKGGQSQHYVFNLGAGRPHWDAALITKTDARNIAEAFGQFPVTQQAVNPTSLADLERKVSAKSQARYESISIEEGGIVAINACANTFLDVMVAEFCSIINLNQSATLTHNIFRGAIKSRFSIVWSDAFLEHVGNAMKHYETHIRTNTDAPEADANKADEGTGENTEQKAKVDRSSKAKRAAIHVSVGKIRHALQNRGIGRISEGVDVECAALVEEFIRQLLLYCYERLRETTFACIHLLSAAQTFGPFRELRVDLSRYGVPMLNPANFETVQSSKHGHVGARFHRPLTITQQDDDVIIRTRESDQEIIEKLRKENSPGTPSCFKSTLGFGHIYLSKTKQAPVMHDNVQTVAKVVKAEAKTEVSTSQKSSKKRKRNENEEAAAGTTEEPEVQLKKKQKQVKAT